jgi:hypothetical protein
MTVNCAQARAKELAFRYSTNGKSLRGNHSGHFLITIDADRRREVLVPFIAYME